MRYQKEILCGFEDVIFRIFEEVFVRVGDIDVGFWRIGLIYFYRNVCVIETLIIKIFWFYNCIIDTYL
jgi:hypothetical protein